MQKKKKSSWNTSTVVLVALLVAMNIILKRLIVIELGFGRISIGDVCTVMAGLWFGPIAGVVCGLISDLLGCIIRGYAVNPLITAAAILWGLIPGLVRPMLSGKKIKQQVILCASIVVSSIISTLILTTAGLVLFQGYHFLSIMPERILQWAVMTPIYCVLAMTIYFSPITSMALNTTGRYVNHTTKKIRD